jgi:hypothetical protein
MKKNYFFILLATFALFAMLFVSCSAEVTKAADDLVYASFDDAAKALSYSYDLPEYSGLYWQYSAYKTDNYGASGATWNGQENESFVPVTKDANNEPLTGYAGKVGPFSQGNWHFKLQGYADASFTKMIYEGEADAKLKKNQTNYIAVTIHDASLTGAIVFDNAYFEWEELTSETGNLTLSIYMSGTNLNHNYTYTETLTQGGAPDYRYYFAGDANHVMKPSENAVQVNEVASDLYTVTVVVRTTDGDLVFADQNLAMQVYGGINNVITGNLIEGLSENNYFAEPVHERDTVLP